MAMMGILFLSYPFPSSTYLGANEFIRFTFGGLLIVYGIFRAFNAYTKLKRKDRKYHYYEPLEKEDDQ